MKNMKVAHKLILGFSIVAFVSLIVGCVGVVGLLTLNKSEDILYREGVESLTGINGMYCVIVEQRLELRGIIINIDDKEAANRNVEMLRAREDEFEELYQDYYSASSGTDAKENALMETTMGVYNGQYKDLKEQMITALEAGEKAVVREAFDQIGEVSEKATDALYEMVSYANERAAMMNEQDNRTAFLLVGVSAALTVLLVALSVILGLYISGIISKPLAPLTGFMKKAGTVGDIARRQEDIESIERYSQQKDEIGQVIYSTSNFIKRMLEISGVLEQVSNGDLTAELDLLSDTDTMGLSLRKMIENLNSMFGEINASAGQVTIGSKQIADGAQALAQGSTEQAAAVEQLSSSITEVAQKTKDNAEMATKAAKLADTIKQSAEKGSHQMEQMMEAVWGINQASQNISKIIKVIDDIAFQTNILALNAAVEAARAGQHGKGFAVVAEEVRNLAAKSAEAAKDTESLIADSMERAESGTRIAGATSESLAEIVVGINESSQLVSQIARSSEEQSMAIEQINTGIDQVAQVVQQNSATAEESAAASEEMSGQSDMLAQLISQFKLKDDSIIHQSMRLSTSLPKTSFAMPEKKDYAHKGGSSNFGKY